MSITVPCYGVCGGVPGWRDPSSGLHCALCGGSAKVTTYNQRETLEHEWEQVKAARRLAAELAEKKRAGQGK